MIGRVLAFILMLFTDVSWAQKVNFTKADTYQRHTELVWDVKDVNGAEYFRIMRSDDNLAFTAVKTITTKQYMDFSSSNKLDTFYYFIQALNGLNQVIAVSDTIKATEYVMSDDQLMEISAIRPKMKAPSLLHHYFMEVCQEALPSAQFKAPDVRSERQGEKQPHDCK